MNTANDCLQDFRNKCHKFSNDDLNTSLAMECAVSAWTVIDWVFKCDGERLNFTNLRELQDYVRDECPKLGYLQDIANARKHKTVTFYEAKVKQTNKHLGSFSTAFSRDFDITRLEFSTGSECFSFQDTFEDVLAFFKKYFEQNNIT